MAETGGLGVVALDGWQGEPIREDALVDECGALLVLLIFVLFEDGVMTFVWINTAVNEGTEKIPELAICVAGIVDVGLSL